MGIDAQMYLKTRKLSNEELRDLRYDVAEAFGHDNFFLSEGEKDFNYKHCIKRIKKNEYNYKISDEVK